MEESKKERKATSEREVELKERMVELQKYEILKIMRTRDFIWDEIGEGGKADIAVEQQMDRSQRREKRRVLQVSS